MSLYSKSNFDELQWVIQIRRTLEEEVDEDGEFPVSIFSVPKLLMVCDQDSYIPQHVALGPYHYWRPELYEMQRYKLAAAKRFQKQLQSLKLDNLVDQLTMLEQRVRACYHKFLDFNGETLVWMMAIDASFLVEFLQVFVPCKMEQNYHVSHDAILRDVVMLENQIPLFVLRKMLEFKFSSLEATDEILILKFISLFKEISPFKMVEEEYPHNIQVSKSAHLLDFLYHMIVPNVLEQEQGAKILKQPLEYLFFSQNEGESMSSSLNMNKPPLVEEITIPSVSELLNCGVNFLPTKGSISNISFDVKTCTLYLPTIGLDDNTKVFLKNLVAYEASVAWGPLVITRYTELMNGIIDSEEDAKILRGKGIIVNHLKSDEEVANMWNGMSKSLRLSREPLLDKVIEDVNKYYNGRMKVKVMKFMKAYVFGSWQILTFLATILLLLLMTLQAFCSVYTCKYTFSDTSE
uniref:UPF0481 protein At3g02645 family n=1 Tax=Cajanus cajan TaxID=3821 RepID=A0A151QV48_CAJCA|nr:Putative UPF0481 protein At3g02645 family [Cajanus cajan]